MRILLAIAALLLTQGTASATGAPPACGFYTAAFYEYGLLYQRDADGSWSGIDKDVLDEISRRTGCTFHTTLESRVRIWARLENQTLDVATSGISTPEREKIAHFIPYIGARYYLLVNRAVPTRLHPSHAFAADPQLKIAVVKSFSFGAFFNAWLEPLRAQGRVYEVADMSAMLHLFKIGRVQAMLAIPTALGVYLDRDVHQRQFIALDYSQKNDIVAGLVLSRQKVPPHAVEAMREALHAMREDGTLMAIVSRYVGPEIAADFLSF